MRKVLIAMLAVGGMGILGTSSTFALPANGNTIGGAAATTSIVQDVRDYHITRTSRWYHVYGNLGRYACHIRGTSRFYAGRCR